MLRGAGMRYRNGYNAHAMPELAVKMRMVPSNNNKTMIGISHHFFSWRENLKKSLSNDHMELL